MTNHTKECKQAQSEYEEYKRGFIRTFPNYCRNCNGWGGFYDPGISGGPPDAWEPPSFDPCDKCEGKCPCCGYEYKSDQDYEIFIEGDSKCPICSFNFLNGEALAEPPGCLCFLEEEH